VERVGTILRLVHSAPSLHRHCNRATNATGVEEADAILLVADGQEGLQPGDREIIDWLRTTHPGKAITLAVNKCESVQKGAVQVGARLVQLLGASRAPAWSSAPLQAGAAGVAAARAAAAVSAFCGCTTAETAPLQHAVWPPPAVRVPLTLPQPPPPWICAGCRRQSFGRRASSRSRCLPSAAQAPATCCRRCWARCPLPSRCRRWSRRRGPCRSPSSGGPTSVGPLAAIALVAPWADVPVTPRCARAGAAQRSPGIRSTIIAHLAIIAAREMRARHEAAPFVPLEQPPSHR
jgi:hypothetical protein